MAALHYVEIVCEHPSRDGVVHVLGGHRARCSCGWSSDCYAQISDTQRAIEVHIRRARRLEFDGLIERSSIGEAIADVKKRGIAAHLRDLDKKKSRHR